MAISVVKETRSVRRESKVIKCSCVHADQNTMYGPGMRLHNPGGKIGALIQRCTVCLKEVPDAL